MNLVCADGLTHKAQVEIYKTAGDIESLAVLYVCVSLAKTPVGDFA